MMTTRVTIYTDGGANPNPGPGGWGVVLIAENGVERELSGGDPATTNNRMELTAVIEALRALKWECQIDLYVDSEYVKKGITEWMPGWVRRNWKNKKGDPVANRDLWETLHALVEQHEIEWHWVRGHSGNKYNEWVDQLATAARPNAPTVGVNEDKAALFVRITFEKKGHGAGGWAYRLIKDGVSKDASGRLYNLQSSIELELRALLRALQAAPENEPLQVFCPGEFSYKGMTQWINNWRKNDWQSSSKKPVKYADVWQKILEESKKRQVEWVMEDREHTAKWTQNLDKLAASVLDDRD
jgi:ribonuclease HI